MVSFITKKITVGLNWGEEIQGYFLLMDSFRQCAKYSWERIWSITTQFVDFMTEHSFSVVEISICEYLIDRNENFIPQQNWNPLKCAPQLMDFRREDIKSNFDQTNKLVTMDGFQEKSDFPVWRNKQIFCAMPSVAWLLVILGKKDDLRDRETWMIFSSAIS